LTLSDFRQAEGRLVRSEFAQQEVFFDTNCAMMQSIEGEAPLAMTQEAAAALLAENPTANWDSQAAMVRSYATGIPVASNLADGSTLSFAGSYDVGGSEVPIIVAISNRGIASVRLNFGSLTEAKLEQVRGSLNDRYTLVFPSDAQISDFTFERTNCLSYASEDGRVVLLVRRNSQNPNGLISVLYGNDHRDRQEIARCLPAGISPSPVAGAL
jgi:hypothetical protein